MRDGVITLKTIPYSWSYAMLQAEVTLWTNRMYLKGVLVLERMLFQAVWTVESMVSKLVQLFLSLDPWRDALSSLMAEGQALLGKNLTLEIFAWKLVPKSMPNQHSLLFEL